jgi:hypothetical protein
MAENPDFPGISSQTLAEIEGALARVDVPLAFSEPIDPFGEHMDLLRRLKLDADVSHAVGLTALPVNVLISLRLGPIHPSRGSESAEISARLAHPEQGLLSVISCHGVELEQRFRIGVRITRQGGVCPDVHPQHLVGVMSVGHPVFVVPEEVESDWQQQIQNLDFIYDQLTINGLRFFG